MSLVSGCLCPVRLFTFVINMFILNMTKDLEMSTNITKSFLPSIFTNTSSMSFNKFVTVCIIDFHCLKPNCSSGIWLFTNSVCLFIGLVKISNKVNSKATPWCVSGLLTLPLPLYNTFTVDSLHGSGIIPFSKLLLKMLVHVSESRECATCKCLL